MFCVSSSRMCLKWAFTKISQEGQSVRTASPCPLMTSKDVCIPLRSISRTTFNLNSQSHLQPAHHSPSEDLDDTPQEFPQHFCITHSLTSRKINAKGRKAHISGIRLLRQALHGLKSRPIETCQSIFLHYLASLFSSNQAQKGSNQVNEFHNLQQQRNMEHVPIFKPEEITEYESLSTTEQFREALLKRSNSSETLAEFMVRVYSLATDFEWDTIKKCGLLNLSLKVLGDLVKSHCKQDFVELLSNQTQLATRRDGNYKRLFNQNQINHVHSFFQNNLLPYYQLYRIILDSHYHFRLQTSNHQLIRSTDESELTAGAPVDVQSVPVLQEYLGIRHPKEQKKDAKKK